jgi:hypothetical protein
LAIHPKQEQTDAAEDWRALPNKDKKNQNKMRFSEMDLLKSASFGERTLSCLLGGINPPVHRAELPTSIQILLRRALAFSSAPASELVRFRNKKATDISAGAFRAQNWSRASA